MLTLAIEVLINTINAMVKDNKRYVIDWFTALKIGAFP